MGKNIGEDVTVAINSSVALNGTTFTQLFAANPRRVYWAVSNPTPVDVYVTLTGVATGTDETGIWVPGYTIHEDKGENQYTGVISGISTTSNPTVTITEY